MSEEQRNRSEGWKYAKRSGHNNEDLVLSDVKNNRELQQRILRLAHAEGEEIEDIVVGGMNEQSVPSVLDGMTKSKADLTFFLKNNRRIGVSIKKSLAGQVYLISPSRFIDGFERQFNLKIPPNVKRAIELFWGTAPDTIEIVEEYGTENIDYELRKHRLTGDTLQSYDEELYEELLDWFEDNMIAVFEFCFSKGLASNPDNWAELVWYKNELGETNIDAMFNVADVENHISKEAEYGPRTGGSTIKLPFGFVQWHSPRKTVPGDMQFHHSYEDLIKDIEEYVDFVTPNEQEGNG